MDPNAVTQTAQAFGSVFAAVDALGHLNVMQTLLYLLGGLAAILGSASFSQHALEVVYAYLKPPFWMKAFIPMVWSSLVGLLLKHSGMDATTAATAAITFHQLLDKLNDMPWAKSIEDKVMGAVAAKVAASSVILLALMLGAASLHADDVSPTAQPKAVAGWCAGPSLWAGSALYSTTNGGLAPDQSALAGVQFAGYLGSWAGEEFTPTYTLGLMLGFDTAGTSNYPAVGVQGGFYMNGVPVTGFIARRIDVAAQGFMVGLGTSVQFSGWVPFLYLGHPGN